MQTVKNNMNKKSTIKYLIKKDIFLYVMVLPVVIYLIIFNYIPMFGIVIAFQKFLPTKGFLGSEWIGLKNFKVLFGSPDFVLILRNTLSISLLRLICGFPAPIILSLLLNEIRNTRFKKTIQTITYMPHFLSWVIVGGLVTTMLALDGPLNTIIKYLGGNPVAFITSERAFRPILVFSGIWKDVGWNTLFYIAAIANIDSSLYEAAVIDGASRWKQTIYVTIPSIKGIIIVLLIFAVGGIMNAGFEQVLLLQNPLVRDVSEIIDTYVYKVGIQNTNYGFGTAVGLFKSVVGTIMIIITNYAANKVGEDGLW